jgi:DNA helicase HerA-like ATPase
LRVVDGQITARHYILPSQRRTEHLVILGKTGTGKTSLIKSMIARDVRERSGFLCIDLHGDLTPFVLGRIAELEQQTGEDMSKRTVIFNPADASSSVGLNILRTHGSLAPHISEIVSIFRARWQLDRFGARTEELLRNALWVLAEHGLTLTEVAPFLTDLGFRALLVEHTSNPEVRAYFRERYEQLSDAMQTVVREAILNKVSAFTTDPAIRHIVGQQESLNLEDALDRGLWIILQLNKGSLGENSETLAALILTRFKNAIYSRHSRSLFTLYADEVQNLASSGDTFDHLLSEARKFGVSVVTANQHLAQYPAQVRAALFSAGTNVFFRCSPEDAPHIARTLNGGRAVERLIRELPDRRFLIRSGSDPVVEVSAPGVAHNTISTNSLIARSNAVWAKPHAEIEGKRPGNAPFYC